MASRRAQRERIGNALMQHWMMREQPLARWRPSDQRAAPSMFSARRQSDGRQTWALPWVAHDLEKFADTLLTLAKERPRIILVVTSDSRVPASLARSARRFPNRLSKSELRNRTWSASPPDYRRPAKKRLPSRPLVFSRLDA